MERDQNSPNAAPENCHQPCSVGGFLAGVCMTDAERATEWQAVARNLGQVLQNTASWIEEWEAGGFSTRTLPEVVRPDYLRGVFAAQMQAHNLTEE